MENDKIYNGTRYFFEVLIKTYLEVEQNLEKMQKYLAIMEAYQKILTLTKDAQNEIKDSLFPQTSLSLALTQCLAYLEDLLNQKINLYLLLNKRSEGHFFSLTFFKYIRLCKKIESQRKLLEYSLEKLEYGFNQYI